MYHDTYPTASALIDRSTYMDDFATSALDDITTIFSEVTSLLNTIRLPMYKWTTNYPLTGYLADAKLTVTDGNASPWHGLRHQVRHAPG